MNTFYCRSLCMTCLLFLSSSSLAQSLRIAQEHANNAPFQLQIQILESALEHYTKSTQIEWIDSTDMIQARALRALENCTAPFDIFFSGYDPDREQRLMQVEVPLLLGLLGVRGFVTTTAQQDTLLNNHVKDWSIGSGLGWPDTRIMQNEGYQLYQAAYGNLWRMLEAERIQVFQRGLQEAQLEIAQRGGDLVLLDHVVMLYPLAIFLYVSPCRPDIHELLEDALTQSYESGQTEALIRANSQAAYALALLRDTRVQHLVLNNDQVSEQFMTLAEHYFLDEIRALLWPAP